MVSYNIQRDIQAGKEIFLHYYAILEAIVDIKYLIFPGAHRMGSTECQIILSLQILATSLSNKILLELLKLQ